MSDASLLPIKNNQKNDFDFSKLIVVSTSLHIGLLCLTAIQSHFFSREDLMFQDSIRVDLIALPDKIIEPPKANTSKTNKPSSKKEVQLPKETSKIPSKEKRALDEKKALNKLKAMEAIEKLKKQIEEKNKENSESHSDSTEKAQENLEIKYKGGKISPGSSYKGLDKIRYDEYLSQLKTHIKSHWHLPPWLAEADLHASAVILVDQQGYIVGKILSLPSGNSVYDKKVMEALEKASPLPQPPSRLSNQLMVDGIEVNFP